MGLIDGLMGMLFGSNRNIVRETAEVFRVNAEADAERGVSLRSEVLQQFAAEFTRADRSGFDRFMDGLNRVPRPAMAFGTIALFVAAMVDPAWFAARMSGLALVPEPLWWLLAAIVSFYFGARHQAKGQAFQRDLAETLARAPQVVEAVRGFESMRDVSPGSDERPHAPRRDTGPDRGAGQGSDPDPDEDADTGTGDTARREPNRALADWRASQRG